MTVNDFTTPNDLTAPLGVSGGRAARRRLRLPVAAMLGVAAGLVIAFAAVWVTFVNDPLGGEPMVVVSIDKSLLDAPPKPVQPPAAPALPAAPAVSANVPSGSNIEMQAGVMVVRGGPPPASQPVAVTVPDAAARGTALAPTDQSLTQQGREGSLPRIADDGRRPADVYARPVIVPPALAGKNPPRIALLVGGMGISQNGTAEAIAKLPPAVTLAFAPYGSDLDRIVREARGSGHEVMLQAPMEPFDYPDNDPGPQTLLTSEDAPQNLDRLHWQMSRFGGYVGLTNYMGAKFTSNEDALTPILKDIAARGLIFADDGSSARSLVTEVGGKVGLAAPTADLTVDQTPTPEAITAALGKLEDTARARGTAFGVATGLPVTIAQVSQWAATLEKRGILLVPVSALAKH